MGHLTRKQVLQAIKGAGAVGDKRGFHRLYTENRVSYEAALAAFRDGVRFGKAIQKRDAEAANQQ